MKINEFSDGCRVTGFYLVNSSSKCLNNSGSPYLNIELRDNSGTINAKKWEVVGDDESIFQAGNFVYVDGEVLKYKDAFQLKILGARAADLNEINPMDFLKEPPIKKEILIEKFNNFVNSIKNQDCKQILDYFIDKYKDSLYIHPAGVSVHHEYSSGLLMHLTTMAEIADTLVKYYEPINRDLLITGVLLHDFGKMVEFTGPVVYKYTLEGKLLGHIPLMISDIREAAKKLNINSEIPLLLEHMVMSHHGTPEFGSSVTPLIKEALLLSMVDLLDCKMTVVGKALDVINPGEMTAKIFPLDGKCFYKPKE